MTHFLIVGISYKSELPRAVLNKILDLFDSKNEVNLDSDDYLTEFPDTEKEKKIAINLNFESKDYKSAVFDIMVKAHFLGRGWKILGPLKMKQYFFAMTLEPEFSDEIPAGITGISIALNKAMTE